MPNITTDSVRIVLFDADDRDYFLILSETDDPDNMKLPGGKFDSESETPDECANREIQEEVSLTDVDLHFCDELVNDDGSSRQFIFMATVNRRDIQPSQEIAKVEWVTQPPQGKNFGHMSSAVQCAKRG